MYRFPNPGGVTQSVARNVKCLPALLISRAPRMLWLWLWLGELGSDETLTFIAGTRPSLGNRDAGLAHNLNGLPMVTYEALKRTLE